MDYYCELGDKTIKIKWKKKHLNTKSHKVLSMSVIDRYCDKNPEIIEIEGILKKIVNIYK